MRDEREKNSKVVVALSGGLDSSVAAALLKRAGFNVIGVFLKLTDLPSFKESERKAKKVAKILKIPLLVLDLKKEFKKRIIDYFLEGYKKGITPNPCVVCNKEIKFGLFSEKAFKLDADYLATGHYARLRQGKLFKARDRGRDQSYFLWMLTQEQLRRTFLPIGNYTGKEVKSLAKMFGLSFLLKTPKSVENCFIPNADLRGFFKMRIHADKGKIINTSGQIIGEHEGLAFYTIGQRKMIGLAGGPYWVLDKDSKKNILIVTKDEKDLSKKELRLKNVNWISGKKPRLPLKATVKVRYRHDPALAVIRKNLKSTIYNLKFARPQRTITPGQSAVFYKGSELLGGGIIC